MVATDKAYLAGLIDGDGSIYIERGPGFTFRISLTIALSHKQTVQWAAKHLNVNVHCNVKGPGLKDSYVAQVRSRKLGPVLLAVLPYLKIKKAQARLGLKLLSLQSKSVKGRAQLPRQHDMYEEMRWLNR